MECSPSSLKDPGCGLDGIRERIEFGLTILSPSDKAPGRRVLFVNSYGGRSAWNKVKNGHLPPHHLWGCIELARMGYEVAIAEPLRHFSYRNQPIPHDLTLFRFARKWLGPDDILFSGHTLLHWLPLLKRIKALKCHLVSLTYAQEDLEFAKVHSGIIALTPAAADRARKMAPNVKVAHLGWGVDLSFFPNIPYKPEWFLACGRTHRDHETLSNASFHCNSRIRLVAPTIPNYLQWSQRVSITTGGKADDTISYKDLLHDYYAQATGSLIILKEDRASKTAVGFTNLIEAMAMGRPVIVTKTGALASELNVESAGCGLHIPPNNPAALVEAMNYLAENPAQAQLMGIKGRNLCRSHYNIVRFSSELHLFFDKL